MSRMSSQEYWEKNIEGFSGFYEKCSQELLQAPGWLTTVYKTFVFPMEKNVMKKRFEMVSSFIAAHVRSGVRVADIGCGGGVYTKKMASMGAHVYATDFADSAIQLTKKQLTPEEAKNVNFSQMDIMSQSIPKVDMAISIGVVPYIDRLDSFLDNVLPHTNLFLFNFLNMDSWINRIRHKVALLDVRGYFYHTPHEVRAKLAARGFEIVRIQKLATGCMVEAKRTSAKK